MGVAISSGGGGMLNLVGCCCDPSTLTSIFPLEHVEEPAFTHNSLFLLEHVEVPALKPNPKDDSVTRCSHRMFHLCFSLFECDFRALLLKNAFVEKSLLRWLTSQKTDDDDKKCSFLNIKDLKPLNTCKKYFGSILLNLPLVKC